MMTRPGTGGVPAGDEQRTLGGTWLIGAGLFLFGVSLAGFVLTARTPDPTAGANIDAGFAAVSMTAALCAVILGWTIRSSQRSRTWRGIAPVGGIVLLLYGAQMVVLAVLGTDRRRHARPHAGSPRGRGVSRLLVGPAYVVRFGAHLSKERPKYSRGRLPHSDAYRKHHLVGDTQQRKFYGWDRHGNPRPSDLGRASSRRVVPWMAACDAEVWRRAVGPPMRSLETQKSQLVMILSILTGLVTWFVLVPTKDVHPIHALRGTGP